MLSQQKDFAVLFINDNNTKNSAKRIVVPDLQINLDLSKLDPTFIQSPGRYQLASLLIEERLKEIENEDFFSQPVNPIKAFVENYQLFFIKDFSKLNPKNISNAVVLLQDFQQNQLKIRFVVNEQIVSKDKKSLEVELTLSNREVDLLNNLTTETNTANVLNPIKKTFQNSRFLDFLIWRGLSKAHLKPNRLPHHHWMEVSVFINTKKKSCFIRFMPNLVTFTLFTELLLGGIMMITAYENSDGLFPMSTKVKKYLGLAQGILVTSIMIISAYFRPGFTQMDSAAESVINALCACGKSSKKKELPIPSLTTKQKIKNGD